MFRGKSINEYEEVEHWSLKEVSCKKWKDVGVCQEVSRRRRWHRRTEIKNMFKSVDRWSEHTNELHTLR